MARHSRSGSTPDRAIQFIKSEEERLRDFIHRYEPDAEVFIHPNPQKDKLKEAGFEKFPATWRGNEIWIQRKPKSDQKFMEVSA